MTNSLQKFSYNAVPVLTTKQLAEVYETNEVNISNNFKRNEERFEEGKHYFLLQGEELKVFKGSHLNVENLKYVSILYLWTERGANRHSKILDTDKAWEQFENLEETYFKVKEQQIQVPTDPMSLLKTQFQVLEKHDEEIKDLKSVVIDMKENSPLFGVESDELQNTVKKVAVKTLGGYRSPAYNDVSLRRRVFSDVQIQLRREFGVKSYKAIKRCELPSAIEILNSYQTSHTLSKEIKNINNQISLY